MDKQMIISVMSRDRTGIVADITGAIYELGGDLADLNQSTLCGYLTMILFASFDTPVTADMLSARIAEIDSPTHLDVVVRELSEPVAENSSDLPQRTYIMTTQGINRKGIVYGISSFCFENDINIMDLATTTSEDTYTMVLQLDLTAVASITDVRRKLQQYADEHELQVVLQHHDLFKVTNEIPF